MSPQATKALETREIAIKLEAKYRRHPEGYISHIRFPRFKNLVPGALLTLEFPLTVLIGPNGSGKTSVLHALYGAPRGKSTSDFWFSTACDPITEGGGEPNRYIYGHTLNTGEVVETRKARVTKKADPDYWEPTKATVADGMSFDSTLPEIENIRSKDRWNPVKKPVLYLNFRSELSAFDKYMFFGTSTSGTKQAAMRRRSPHLKQVMDTGQQKHTYFGANRVTSNRELTPSELVDISTILGRTYTGARAVRHALFENRDGLSVRFTQPALTYTEAFAGSGELAVASMVMQVAQLSTPTLILLDEPEVSLHPGAQKALTRFLLRKVLENGHQIVLSTHSPYVVDGLPSKAVKAFTQSVNGKYDIINDCEPASAFHVLGVPPPNKIQVFVEDRLAAMIVNSTLRLLTPPQRSLFKITVLPGGANAYKTHRIPTLMMDASDKSLFILDGDQCKVDPSQIKKSDEFAPSQEPTLVGYITTIAGGAPALLTDGAGGQANQAQKVVLQRRYIDYFRARVRYLPRKCPEEILQRLVDINYEAETSQAAKNAFRLYFSNISDDLTQGEMEGWASVAFAKSVTSNSDASAIAATLRESLSLLS